MAYTPDKPELPESVDELRARIPGWGADLDPKDRPSVPQEVFDPEFGGAHWEFPERQPELRPRERSIEHAMLTPVFGTSAPPRGLSGVIRRYSYATYSEGRAAHWLLLLAADRVDVLESALRSFLTTRPDNPITQTGVRGELTHHGLRSRLGHNRADVAHHPLDPVIVLAPWVIGAGIAYVVARRLTRRS
ncbi:MULTISPECIES: hypothetical protein [Catenuloplanes]|uniref:Uncharacterized protein n=1 Tax=Catenuloplanes niger TaxID=587534 RepID=A0AAE4CQG4_9ACTN|nr:hypothetical protein [Catenuloplanes niger]MDR7320875.1 hypothetical protein [Catenuloplanes niger]